jgi:hypothetical protein
VVPGVLSPRGKEVGHESDFSSPSNSKVKNKRTIKTNILFIFIEWSLIKSKAPFNFIIKKQFIC